MMKFYSEKDSSFISFIWITVIIVTGVILFPFLIGLFFGSEPITFFEAMMVLMLLAVSVGIILWTVYFIQYVFHDDYLYIRGGPFRKRIAYEEITKVTQSNDVMTGFRILSSKNAIEIFYQSGSIKISPQDREIFISEIKKRCPNAVIQIEW